VEVRTNRIGEHTFIGNSAFVPAGIDIGDDCLIGVMSPPPPGLQHTDEGTRWLGSPGFELPRSQDVSKFSDRETYHPNARPVALRLVVEIMRLLLPNMIAILDIVLFCAAITYAYLLAPLWALAFIVPCAAFALSYVAVAIVAILKTIMIGNFKPVVKPLRCGYIWLNEVVNAVYETIAAVAMTPLMGTPFIAPCLRMMGCKVGRWAVIETTMFSEFDLVEIGDRAALNLGATIQTHLFEDRVMESDYLKIGTGCSVGNMPVVLYGTVMGPGSVLEPLSVLMKGETLPPSSRWTGIPTRPVDATIEVAAVAAPKLPALVN
jgi:non-ribosomal peptide synthetase-like protein